MKKIYKNDKKRQTCVGTNVGLNEGTGEGIAVGIRVGICVCGKILISFIQRICNNQNSRVLE